MNTSIDIARRRLNTMVGSFVRDWRCAQRLLLTYQLAPERFVFAPRGVPATYPEFLFMTSGKLPHEPSARERARGTRQVAG